MIWLKKSQLIYQHCDVIDDAFQCRTNLFTLLKVSNFYAKFADRWIDWQLVVVNDS